MGRAKTHIVISHEEAIEIYRFTRNAYINPNNYPELLRLIDRVTQYLDAQPNA